MPDSPSASTSSELSEQLISTGIVTRADFERVCGAETHFDAQRLANRLRDAGLATDHQANAIAQNRAGELRFGPYVVLEHLGKGGMGDVFKARHVALDRIVAIKTIRVNLFQDDTAIQRFLRECKVLGPIQHPNVVAVQFADRHGDTQYLAMEYIEGATFTRLAREAQSPLPLSSVCDWIAQAAAGLNCAHRMQIVHRDVKPDNLMLTRDGVVKVLDLGLAKFINESDSLTNAGTTLGTYDYMAPEQWRDSRRVDARTDIYALGCTLYFLCAGRHPYAEKTDMPAKMIGHTLDPPPSLRNARPDASQSLEAVYQKMVAKDPDDRFATMEDVISALTDAVRHPDPATAADPASLSARSTGIDSTPAAHRRKLVVIGAFFVIGFAIVATLMMTSTDSQPKNTDRELTQPPPGGFAESIGIKLVPISPGRFEMGASDNEEGSDDERPRHEVEIAEPFLMSAHEITVGQFHRFVDEEGHLTDAERDGQGGFGWDEAKREFRQDPRYIWTNPKFAPSEDHPVVNISWKDAERFCEWLSRKDGREFALPTEAQWEYACRAGSSSRYSFGDNPEELYRIDNVYDAAGRKKAGLAMLSIAADDGYAYAAPVGRFAPNPWGLHDMHGNVSEWCRDVYDSAFYRRSPPRDPVNSAISPNAATPRQAIRGGSWRDAPTHCRSARRGWNAASSRSGDLGFRVVSISRSR